MSANGQVAQHVTEGLSYAEAGKFAESLEEFRRALALEPGHELALRGQAMSQRALRKAGEAGRSPETAAAPPPPDADLLLDLASLLSAQAEPARALAVVEQALAAAPRLKEAHLWKVFLLTWVGRFDEAERAAAAALQLLPGDSDVLLQEAGIYYSQGSYERTLGLVSKVLAAEPQNPRALYYQVIALRLLAAREAPAADAKAAQAAASPGDEAAARAAAEAARQLDGWLTQAEAAWRAAWALRPNVRSPLRGRDWIFDDEVNFARTLEVERGRLHTLRKQYPAALEAFVKAADEAAVLDLIAKLPPGTDREKLGAAVAPVVEAAVVPLPVLRAAATAYLHLQRLEGCLDAFDRILEVEREDEAARLGKLYALRELGRRGQPQRLAEADRLVEEALAKSPTNRAFLTERGNVYGYQRRFTEAAEAFLEAETDEDYLGWTLWSLRSQRRLAEAERLLLAATEKHPQSLLLANEMALLYADRGQFEKALERFEAALRLAAEARAARAEGGGPDGGGGPLKGEESVTLGRITMLRNLGRRAEVERELREARRRLGHSPVFWYEAAYFHIGAGDYREALAAVDRAAEASYAPAVASKIAMLRMAARAGDRARLGEAVELAEDALKKFPDQSHFIHAEAGWAYLDLEQPEQAERRFATALEADGSLVAAGFGRAEALVRMQRHNDARAVLESLEELYPDDYDVVSQLGWFYLSRDELEKAREQFRRLLGKDGQSIHALNGLAGVFYEDGQHRTAEEYISRAVELAPADPTLRANLARALARQGTPSYLERAERECREALRFDRYHAGAHGCLGSIAFERGDLTRSESHLRDSIRLGGRDGGHADLGGLYIRMGRYEEAGKCLDEALRVNPDAVQARIQRGNLLLHTEKFKEAVCEFRRAAETRRTSWEAQHSLAIGLIRAGDMKEAEEVLRRAVSTLDEGRRWRCHLLLAQLLTKRGDETEDSQWYADALKQVTEARRLAPDGEGDAHFVAGIIHHKLGNNDRAARSFRLSLEKNKNNYEAERNLQLILSQRKDRQIQRVSTLIAFLLCGVSLTQLAVLWYVYLKLEKISEAWLMTLVPILLGLAVLAPLLPWLAKLKLPGGVEAELSQESARESLPTGPKGSMSISLPTTAGSDTMRPSR